MADDVLRELERALREGGGWSARRRYAEALRRAGRPAEAYRCLQRGAVREPEALNAICELQGPVRGAYDLSGCCDSPPPSAPASLERLWRDPARIFVTALASPLGPVVLSNARSRDEGITGSGLNAGPGRVHLLDPDGGERYELSGRNMLAAVSGRDLLLVSDDVGTPWNVFVYDLLTGEELVREFLWAEGYVSTLSPWGVLAVRIQGGARTLDVRSFVPGSPEAGPSFRRWSVPLAPELTAASERGVVAVVDGLVRLFDWEGTSLGEVKLPLTRGCVVVCDAEGVVAHDVVGRLTALNWSGKVRWESGPMEQPCAIAPAAVLARPARGGPLEVLDRLSGESIAQLEGASSATIQGDRILWLQGEAQLELVASDLTGQPRWSRALPELSGYTQLLSSPPYAVYLGSWDRGLWRLRSE